MGKRLRIPNPGPAGIANKGLARTLLALSGLVFTVATACMALRIEPFFSSYFCFAWWPYILAAESVLHLQGGDSELFRRPLRFLGLLPLSVSVWLIFEVFNFRLSNWHYLNVPAQTPLRWLGYAVSFSTVLPGLLVTARLLEHGGLGSRAVSRPLARAARLYPLLTSLGLACLILPLAWPEYFFPLIWGGFLFLLEPWLHKTGAGSILADLEQGRPRRLALLLSAGLVCGGLWETWNYWAGSKWFYTVPFVGELKVFEMPVLGYLGFPPFAVQCHAMTCAFLALAERVNGLPGRSRALVWTCLAACAAAFDLLAFMGIDRFTVASFAG
ncbi:MAG: hypothetical protein JW718_06420 [Desulfovibrionaceae bacterium]|nr:hypothetical protein [Desulfovibrionaceae bacterium]